MAPFARSQSEPRRRLALASGFALFRSFGIDRLDEPGLSATFRPAEAEAAYYAALDQIAQAA